MADKLIVLFDDERSFVPGFRDDAVVIRYLDDAIEYFAGLKASGQRIDELWFDFVLSPGCTYEALYDFPGELLDRAIYHSSSWGGHGIIAEMLKDAGYQGELERVTSAFPGQANKIFS